MPNIERASKDAIRAIEERRKNDIDQRRKEHPEDFPEYLNMEQILGREKAVCMTTEIHRYEKKSVADGNAFESRNLHTNEKNEHGQPVIISLSGAVVIKNMDRFMADITDSEMPVTVRMTIWRQISEKTKNTYYDIDIERVD